PASPSSPKRAAGPWCAPPASGSGSSTPGRCSTRPRGSTRGSADQEGGKPVVERDSMSRWACLKRPAWDNGATTKDGPGGSLREQRTEVPGPRPTLDRSAEL